MKKKAIKKDKGSNSNIIKIMIFAYAILLLIFFALDFFNIPSNLPKITKNYDWLSFLGGYAGGFATLILGFVTLSQNESQSKELEEVRKENKKLTQEYNNIAKQETVILGASRITVYKKQVIVLENKKDPALFLYLQDTEKKGLKNILIKAITVTELEEQYHEFEKDKEKHRWEIYKEEQGRMRLEYTPLDSDQIEYYGVKIKIDNEFLKREIESFKYLRFEIEAEVENSYNILHEQEFRILTERKEKRTEDEIKRDHYPLEVYHQSNFIVSIKSEN